MRARVVAAVVAVAVAGCGDDSRSRGSAEDQRGVRNAVEGYFIAFADGGGDRACQRLTPEVQEEFASRGGASCGETLQQVVRTLPRELRSILRDTRIAQVTVEGDEARARVRVESRFVSPGREVTIRLSNRGGTWLLSEAPDGPGPDPVTTCVAGGLEVYEEGEVDPLWKREGRRDFVHYLAEVCRRTAEEDVVDRETPKERGEFDRIAQEVVTEMVRAGRIERGG